MNPTLKVQLQPLIYSRKDGFADGLPKLLGQGFL
jgi:hypothetical protein